MPYGYWFPRKNKAYKAHQAMKHNTTKGSSNTRNQTTIHKKDASTNPQGQLNSELKGRSMS